VDKNLHAALDMGHGVLGAHGSGLPVEVKCHGEYFSLVTGLWERLKLRIGFLRVAKTGKRILGSEPSSAIIYGEVSFKA
jgi:hypothetical protein